MYLEFVYVFINNMMWYRDIFIFIIVTNNKIVIKMYYVM